ncbi:MAG: hypothetical protein AMXMBFR57_15080 [Acidimicrobiia bacterium]
MRVVSALILLLCVVAPAAAQVSTQTATPPPATPPAQTTPTPTPTGPPADYLFTTAAGMLLFHVDPAKTAEFDVVVGRLIEAFKATKSQSRQLQAANWKIYKSAEKTPDSILYVFLFDPAIEKMSYDPLLYLAEVAPAEVQPLFERMKTAVLRVERLGLTKVR